MDAAGFASAESGGVQSTSDSVTTAPGEIAWIPTWEAGLAEAKRLDRPILLVSAAPHCHNISGLW